MCSDGTSVPLPDVDLSYLARGSSLIGGDFTCGVIEAVSRSVEEESQECIDAHSIAGVCGCPPIENACDFCPGENVVFPDKEVLLALNIIDVVPTCSQIDAFVTQLESGSKLCFLAQSTNYFCGSFATAAAIDSELAAEHLPDNKRRKLPHGWKGGGTKKDEERGPCSTVLPRRGC
jgi:hypothetical protein